MHLKPETRRQYPRRLKVFFDYLNINGSINEQVKEFIAKARNDPQWAQDNLIEYIIEGKLQEREKGNSNFKGADAFDAGVPEGNFGMA